MKYRFTEEPHAHWLDDKPLLGTTTVLGIISKELTWWASGMAIGQLGWLNPKKHSNEERYNASEEVYDLIRGNFSAYEYQQLLDKAYRAHHDLKEKRAMEGTDIHSEVEKYISFKMNGGEVAVTDHELFPYVPPEIIMPFVKWCDNNVKTFLFSEIHCYDQDLWVGGKTDFGYENLKGEYVLADVKSRDKAYFSDFIQVGGYDLQITKNGGFDKDGNKIFHLDKPFSYHAMFPVTEKFKEPFISSKITRNKESFCHAVGLYKAKQEFEGSST